VPFVDNSDLGGDHREALTSLLEWSLRPPEMAIEALVEILLTRFPKRNLRRGVPEGEIRAAVCRFGRIKAGEYYLLWRHLRGAQAASVKLLKELFVEKCEAEYREAIDRLTDDQVEAFLLRKYTKIHPKAIAWAMGIELNMLNIHFHEAKDALARHLGEGPNSRRRGR